MIKRAIILGCIGFVIGIMIGLTICFIEEHRILLGGMDILMYLVGGLQGALAMGTTVFYDIESWSILRSTITHFIVTFGGFYAMGYIQGWMRPGEPFSFIFTIAFIVAYIIIWLTQYFSYKRTVRMMNAELKDMKRE